jgi:hypothetical protein
MIAKSTLPDHSTTATESRPRAKLGLAPVLLDSLNKPGNHHLVIKAMLSRISGPGELVPCYVCDRKHLLRDLSACVETTEGIACGEICDGCLALNGEGLKQAFLDSAKRCGLEAVALLIGGNAEFASGMFEAANDRTLAVLNGVAGELGFRSRVLGKRGAA